MPEPRPALPPWLGVAVAVLSVSFAAPLFKLANAPPLTASFWRLGLACLLLLPFSRRAWPAWRSHTRQDWLVLLASGLALAAHFGLWVTSLGLTTVAASTTLVTLQAVFVALGGHFLLGDRLSAANWTGVAVAFAGSAAIAFADGAGAGQSILGDVLALAAGLGSAAYFLIGRRLRATRGLVEYVLPVYAFAALALLVSLPIVGQPLFAATMPLDCLAWLGANGTFAAFVLLAAVPMLGGHTVANWTVKYLPAHTVATWILLEPVGAALLAWAIPCIAQVPSRWTVIGGALVLLGATLTVPHKGKGAATEPAG
ncbi:MAG: DMT family transporter [Thermoplasmatota archaeon]|nr:DMT family transporter [Halobacteriales archaeon]